MMVGAGAVFLYLSLVAPLWMLALGPLVYGVPHLWASFRYTTWGLGRPWKGAVGEGRPLRLDRGVVAGLVLSTLVFFFYLQGWLDYHLPRDRPWIYIVAALIALSVFLVHLWPQLWGLAQIRPFDWLGPCLVTLSLVTALYYGSWKMAGAMILIHHFVAFGFWIRATQNTRERAGAWLGLGVFSFVHLLILAGWCDGWFESLWHSEAALDLGLTMRREGRGILGHSSQGSLPLIWCYRLVVCYAFGQALHYVLWLKVIPEANYRLGIPTSFTRSWQLLKKNLGKTMAVFAVMSSVAFISVWILGEFRVVRQGYLALAFFHGFFEIVTLFSTRDSLKN